MKYKVGDKVRIKSLDWYNENSNDYYNVVLAGGWYFSKPMSILCGKELIIEKISHATNPPYYMMKDNMFAWTDEMIEGLVEEEIKPKFKVGDKITNGKGTLTILTLTSDSYIVEDTFGEGGTLYFKYQDKWKIVKEETKFGTASNSTEIKSNANCLTRERVDELDKLAVKIDEELPSGNPYVWECPDGYQFTDENGNVINATKIVLEKEKKEYPKTYEECCEVLFEDISYAKFTFVPAKISSVNLSYIKGDIVTDLPSKVIPYKEKLNIFYKLLICRDAYWKIAGEEMGLGRPWEPDCNSAYFIPAIIYRNGFIQKVEVQYRNVIFSFPTKEMQDAFYENFDKDLEFCKEFL